MCAVSDADQWKSVVYAFGGYQADARMGMVKTSAAQNGQRTTALLAAILNASASVERWDRTSSILPWLHRRRLGLFPRHARAVALINYQDELLVEAISPAAAEDFGVAVRTLVAGDLKMEMSGKEETVRPFGCTADFIGAHFHFSSPTQPVFRPVGRFRAKIQDFVHSLRSAKNVLLPLDATLSAAGRLQFSSIFVPGGRFFLNSVCRCVAASPRLRTRTPEVLSSLHLVAHAEALLHALGALAHPCAIPIIYPIPSSAGWRRIPAPHSTKAEVSGCGSCARAVPGTLLCVRR